MYIELSSSARLPARPADIKISSQKKVVNNRQQKKVKKNLVSKKAGDMVRNCLPLESALSFSFSPPTFPTVPESNQTSPSWAIGYLLHSSLIYLNKAQFDCPHLTVARISHGWMIKSPVKGVVVVLDFSLPNSSLHSLPTQGVRSRSRNVARYYCITMFERNSINDITRTRRLVISPESSGIVTRKQSFLRSPFSPSIGHFVQSTMTWRCAFGPSALFCGFWWSSDREWTFPTHWRNNKRSDKAGLDDFSTLSNAL